MGMACACAGRAICQLVPDGEVQCSTAGLHALVSCCPREMEPPILRALDCCALLACHFFRTRAGTPGST